VSDADIVIIGSGSLATKVIYALTQLSAGRLQIAVIGRSKSKVARVTLLANARASAFGRRTNFVSVELIQFKAQAFERLFRSLKPKVIFQATSIQSPWEAAQGQTAWTKLIASAGFGITLPLQLQLAVEVSRGATDGKAAIINASYPDCVNVVLNRLGIRTTCGIGNSAIVEAFCRSHQLGKGNDVRVVGHHGHLGEWLKGKQSSSQPRVWVKEKEEESHRFRPDFGAVGEELNEVTSSTAVTVMTSLLTGERINVSVPGVAGLPGGYPFILKDGKFKMRLPPGIDLEGAVAHNQTGERLDGLELGAGVKFVSKAPRALEAAGFEYARGFDFAEWEAVHDRMLHLRQRLRRANHFRDD
jgi:hypothetical protein